MNEIKTLTTNEAQERMIYLNAIPKIAKPVAVNRDARELRASAPGATQLPSMPSTLGEGLKMLMAEGLNETEAVAEAGRRWPCLVASWFINLDRDDS